MSTAARVPNQSIIDAIMQVRESGVTNMFDHRRVVEELRFISDEAAEWVADNEGEYAKGVFKGFEVG